LSFSALNLHPSLSRALDDLGFEKPTPIQAEAIPAALAGRDVLASAATGSGKTAAFLLPILQRLLALPRGTTRALVLTPTRELAAQIAGDAHDLARHTHLRFAAVYGGVAMGPQLRAFRSGADLIVATPGRLLDHLRQRSARLGGLEVLVLDEADRMLDMGFLPDVKRILAELPRRRQTLFFSATMPAPIAALASEMLRDPATIQLARKAAPAAGIAQAVYLVAQERKAELLASLLEQGEMQDALVFTRTKHRADRLAKYLTGRRVRADRIHGNRSQRQRSQALEGFRAGRTRVLVATDIAARGIDVEKLGHVVNFDVPALPDDYVHRVGRTGRDREEAPAHRRAGLRPAAGAAGPPAPAPLPWRLAPGRAVDVESKHVRHRCVASRARRGRARGPAEPPLCGGDMTRFWEPEHRAPSGGNAVLLGRPAAPLAPERVERRLLRRAGDQRAKERRAARHRHADHAHALGGGLARQREHHVEPAFRQLAVVHDGDEIGVRGVDGHRPVAVGHGRGDAQGPGGDVVDALRVEQVRARAPGAHARLRQLAVAELVRRLALEGPPDHARVDRARHEHERRGVGDERGAEHEHETRPEAHGQPSRSIAGHAISPRCSATPASGW
jgi:ATP-dependent RNA helicase RhlE